MFPKWDFFDGFSYTLCFRPLIFKWKLILFDYYGNWRDAVLFAICLLLQLWRTFCILSDLSERLKVGIFWQGSAVEQKFFSHSPTTLIFFQCQKVLFSTWRSVFFERFTEISFRIEGVKPRSRFFLPRPKMQLALEKRFSVKITPCISAVLFRRKLS